MEVRMESTRGLGREAEVWVGGHLLTVCDGVSDPAHKCLPGLLENVAFSYVAVEPVRWDEAAKANRGEKKSLNHLRGWSYQGYGQVISVMPVVIDFGFLKMTDPGWTTDEDLVGCYVKLMIDRLELSPAYQSDWPKGIGPTDC